VKITKNKLRKVIKEESVRLLKEEGADCIKDYIAMGYSRAEAYKECGAYAEKDSGYRRTVRRTTHVGADANADQIAAVEAALIAKPNNFLKSILTQLKNGRGLSGKQSSIVKSILRKSDPEAAKMFESNHKGNKMKITKRQLRRIIKEERDKLKGMKPEIYYGIENKLVNLLLDMEDIPADQLNDMVERLGDEGMAKVIKLLASMALGVTPL